MQSFFRHFPASEFFNSHACLHQSFQPAYNADMHKPSLDQQRLIVVNSQRFSF
jgi:hypothetical protein